MNWMTADNIFLLGTEHAEWAVTRPESVCLDERKRERDVDGAGVCPCDPWAIGRGQQMARLGLWWQDACRSPRATAGNRFWCSAGILQPTSAIRRPSAEPSARRWAGVLRWLSHRWSLVVSISAGWPSSREGVCRAKITCHEELIWSRKV